MSSRRCVKCGKQYPSSYRKCPYCSARERGSQRPVSVPEQILNILRQKSSRFFVVSSLVFLCIAMLGTLITQCSQPKTEEPDAPQTPVQTAPRPVVPLRLSQSAVTIQAGQTASVIPSGNFDTLIWTTSNEEVASVNNGTITGKSAGTAVIIASTGVEAVSCEVTVEEAPTAPVSQFELALSSTDFTIRSGGDPVQMRVRIKGTRDVYEGEVIWSSQDVSVATISESGLVERVGKGTTTVTAEADGQILECIVRAP